MSYFLDLFSPETYEAFSRSDRTVSGFRRRQQSVAERIRPGDKLLCYMTKLSRWVGVMDVVDGPFIDGSPIFYAQDDPFEVRFHVRPTIWLPVEAAIPIHEERIWDHLSFTRGQRSGSSTWTGKLRSSLVQLDDADGKFVEAQLRTQVTAPTKYPVDGEQYRKFLTHRVRGAEKDVSVTVPEDLVEPEGVGARTNPDSRESIQIQALLSEIGSRMGMQIWVPKADRSRVLSEWHGEHPSILERLPLNYDDTTLKTIEQIDVLWLKGRSIERAFEVEHTTAVYSGILRMADLLALQPNMDIRLHIVAPEGRRDKVFQELRRPVFSLLDRGPLSETCTFLSYDSVRELGAQPHLAYLSDSVLDEYEEETED